MQTHDTTNGCWESKVNEDLVDFWCWCRGQNEVADRVGCAERGEAGGERGEGERGRRRMVSMCVHVCMCMHACMCACVRVCVRACVHACVRECVCEGGEDNEI